MASNALSPAAGARVSGGALARLAASYLKVLSGSVGRMVLQAVYFLVLAGTLSLADLGVFATSVGVGLILSNLSGFGFGPLSFRTAAGHRRLLGAYLGLFYALSFAALPVALAAAVAIWHGLFAGALPLSLFLAIIAVEVLLSRVTEFTIQLSNGLGRFARGAAISMAATGARAAAALAFAFAGGGPLSTWILIYAAANAAVTLGVLAGVPQPARPRLDGRLFRARWRGAMSCALNGIMVDVQQEIDKLMLLALTDQRAVGLYVIATRVMELVAMPMRTFLIVYARQVIKAGPLTISLRRHMTVEAGLAAITVAGFALLMALLTVWPRLLGGNIATAHGLFGAMVLVPAIRVAMELHGELYFAAGLLARRAAMATLLILLKACGLAVLVSLVAEPFAWGPWLNLVHGVPYLVSAAMVYRTLARRRTSA